MAEATHRTKLSLPEIGAGLREEVQVPDGHGAGEGHRAAGGWRFRANTSCVEFKDLKPCLRFVRKK